MKNYIMVFLICLIGSSIFPVNSQAQWIQTNGPYESFFGLYSGTVTSFVSSGSYLFAGTNAKGVYRSTNNGASWTSVNTGLPTSCVLSLAVSGSKLFAGLQGVGANIGGVYQSTDNGESWNDFNVGLTGRNVTALMVIGGTNILAGTANGGIFLSPVDTAGWVRDNSYIFNSQVLALGTDVASLFAALDHGVVRSTDMGQTWFASNGGITGIVGSFAANGSNIFAGAVYGSPATVARSTDGGASWTTVNTGLDTYVQAIAFSGGNLCAGTGSAGVYVSTNNGTSWAAGGIGLYQIDTRVLAVTGAGMLAGTFGSGAFRSIDDGASWTAVNFGLINTNVRCLINTGAGIMAGTANDGIYFSNNSGRTWALNNLRNMNVWTLASNATQFGLTVLAGTSGGVFRSRNLGTVWENVSSGLSDSVVKALALTGYINPVAFVGTASGVFFSTNDGTSWTLVNTGLTNTNIQALMLSGSTLFAGTPSGVFVTADSGAHWTAANSGLSNTNVLTFTSQGTNLFAGTAGGVFLSTDNGTIWNAVNSGLSNTDIRSFAVSGTNLFAGTAGGGVFHSSDNGTIWTAVNPGLLVDTVQALAVSATNLFAGTPSAAIWRRSLSEMITSVELNNSTVPQKYSLEQNYPNPFNPSTTISYQLPSLSHITLKVFDVLGREVATLVNEVEQPGYKSVTFDASKLSSGVYFYRLQAGSFVETKKLLLMK